MKTQDERGLLDLLNNCCVKICDCALRRVEAGWSSGKMAAPYSRIIIIKSGECAADDNCNHLALLPGFVYLIPAGTLYTFYCLRPSSHLYFDVNLTMPNGLDFFLDCDHFCAFVYEKTRLWRLERLFANESLFGTLEIQSEIYLLLSRFVAQVRNPLESMRCYSPSLRMLFRFINDNLSEKLSVKLLAQHMHLSESTLSKRFKMETGMTLRQYIDRLIYQKAQILLLESEASINDIAQSLCFCDQFHFSRYFKQRAGMPPSRYRLRR